MTDSVISTVSFRRFLEDDLSNTFELKLWKFHLLYAICRRLAKSDDTCSDFEDCSHGSQYQVCTLRILVISAFRTRTRHLPVNEAAPQRL